MRPRKVAGSRIEITGFGIGDTGSGMYGGAATRLSALPDMKTATHFLAAVCDHGGVRQGLWIELRLVHGGNAMIRGLDVDYRIGGRTRTVAATARIGACENLDAPVCSS